RTPRLGWLRVRARGQASGFAVRHHGCAAAVRRRQTGLAPVQPRCSPMASCHQTYPPFEVTVQRDNAVATVMVSGEVDLATVPRLSAAVAQHHDAQLLVLALTAVTFIDTTGVRVRIEADRSCAGSGSRVVVLAGDGPVRRLHPCIHRRQDPGRDGARVLSDCALSATTPRRGA